MQTSARHLRERVAGLCSYATLITAELAMIVVLGGWLVRLSAEAGADFLKTVNPPAPNLVQLREQDLVVQALHLPQVHVPERQVVALTSPQVSVADYARRLDEAESSKQTAARERVCTRACRDARVRIALKREKVQVARVALDRRRRGPDTATIFARNFAALGPTYD